MAKVGADGSIILTTEVDTSGLKKGENNIKTAVNKLGKGFQSLGSRLTKAMSSGDAKVSILTDKLKEATKEVEEQKQKVAELKKELDGLESGEIKIQDKGISKLQGDFDKATANAQQLQNEINEIYMQLDKLQSNAFKAPNTGDVVLTGKEEAEFAALNARLDELEPKLTATKARASELGVQLRQSAGTATQAAIEKTKLKLTGAEKRLTTLQHKATQVGVKLKAAMAGSIPGITAVTNGIMATGKRIGSLIKSALVFTLITKAFITLRDTIGNVLMSNQDFRASLEQLKNALWTAFTPILNYIVPAIKTLVNWLTLAITSITRFIAALFGKSYSSMADNAKQVRDQADAYKKLKSGGSSAAKGMKKATDEAKKQLAAFDDLTIISENKSQADSTESGAGGGVPAVEAGDYDIGPISTKLQELMKIVGACLAAVGVLLLFTGHIGWGIGFIIAGASAFAIAAQAESGDDPTKTAETQLAEFGQYLGGALAILGVILLIFGGPKGIALGIGMIVAGIGLFGVSEAKLQEGGVQTKLAQFLKDNETLIVGVSIALLILGIILAMFTPLTGLALGLIAAGAVGLAAEIALNEGTIGEKIATFFKDNAGLIVGVSLALLVLGIILLFVPTQLALGIGLIVVGVAGLATEVALNWSFITEKVSTFFQDNFGLIAGISTALLVLGIILLFVPGAQGIAFALILAGVAGLATAIAFNWDFIVEKVKEIWGKIKEFWNTYIAPVFTAKWWADLGKKALNGLIGIFEKGINYIIGKINVFVRGIDSVISAVGSIFGADWSVAQIPEVKIPRLAKGGIVPHATTALIGEAGKEAVLPLENNTEWMDTLADRIASRNGGSGGSTTVVLEIDGREFGRAVVEQGDKEKRRIGTRLVMA